MAPKIAKPTKPAYLKHPIANPDVVKLELRKKGYQILDLQFAPPNYETPADVQAVLDEAGAYPDPAESAAGPAQPDSPPAATTAPASDEDPAAAAAAAKAAEDKAAADAAAKEAADKAAADKAAADKKAADDAAAAGGKKTADMTDQELREAVEKKTGSKPAWNAKRETLIAALGE